MIKLKIFRGIDAPDITDLIQNYIEQYKIQRQDIIKICYSTTTTTITSMETGMFADSILLVYETRDNIC